LDLVALANVARKRDLHAYCFGAVQKELYEALQRGEIADDRLHQHAELETALAAALNCADTGDVVLLSPAFASFDQYSCFEDRGIHFQQLVENCRQTRNVL
jgi:UDP-N-acetylmuramoylalanine--D-glutamate ligase